MTGTDTVHVLDLAAKIDETAAHQCHAVWGEINFPAPFGRSMTPEELYVSQLDAKSGTKLRKETDTKELGAHNKPLVLLLFVGSSLKLTILNPKGRVWTMVAGGGASVVYSDSICDLGAAGPSQSQKFTHAHYIHTHETNALFNNSFICVTENINNTLFFFFFCR